VISSCRFCGYAIRNNFVRLAGKVQMMSVREMTAMCQIQSKNRVSGLQNRGVGLHVGRRSRVSRHVRVFGAEELLGPLTGQRFGYVCLLARPVAGRSVIALSIFT